jgi:RNA polymerase sigma factor (sigma-70 family)
MRAGAFDFLEKPFEDEILLTRVRAAIAASRNQAREIEERRAVLAALERLTPREREVLPLVAKGLTSKEVARLLGASHRTIEIHRANLMQKLEAPTLADLVRADLLIQAALAQHETP